VPIARGDPNGIRQAVDRHGCGTEGRGSVSELPPVIRAPTANRAVRDQRARVRASRRQRGRPYRAAVAIRNHRSCVGFLGDVSSPGAGCAHEEKEEGLHAHRFRVPANAKLLASSGDPQLTPDGLERGKNRRGAFRPARSDCRLRRICRVFGIVIAGPRADGRRADAGSNRLYHHFGVGSRRELRDGSGRCSPRWHAGDFRPSFLFRPGLPRHTTL
jgi:hypothetical protein